MSRFAFPATATIIAAAIATASPALAHDVWMQADRFQVPVGTEVPYRVFVGHGAAREPWDVPGDRVASLRSIGRDGSIVLNPVKSSIGKIRFQKPGTYIVAMVSNTTLSDLPSLRFNDYAASEGLTPAITLRERLRQTGQNGREVYSRRTKMLIKVGSGRNAELHVTQPVGLSLEIVPQRDPFVTKAGQPLPVQILYQGRPLAGATVKLNNLDADAQPIAKGLTDQTGTVAFPHPGTGRWQFNVVWTRPIIGSRDAEFETTFSSLTFGN